MGVSGDVLLGGWSICFGCVLDTKSLVLRCSRDNGPKGTRVFSFSVQSPVTGRERNAKQPASDLLVLFCVRDNFC